MRVPLVLVLNLFQGCLGLLLAGALRTRVLFGTGSHLYLSCLLHELVKHIIFQYGVIDELEVLEIFHRVWFLATRVNGGRKKACGVPSKLHALIARICPIRTWTASINRTCTPLEQI